MHVHLIAVAGTGMGALAGLLKAAGHRVSGSDVAFYPPMGPALERWGIELRHGFDPAHLDPAPDMVVVGNVCRRDNPEARAAIDGGLKYTSMVGALDELVLRGNSPLVVAGTHGKTTTSSMCAWLLHHAHKQPGFLIGGLPKNFEHSYRLPGGAAGVKHLPLAHRGGSARRTPFVVEGDEYDTAFFEKTPKFWHYRPEVAIITSLEHDHVDIYPNAASYRAAFQGFVERVPATGLIVASADDAAVVEVVQAHAKAEVAWYGLQDDTLTVPPHWLAAPAGQDSSGQAFDLFVGGVMAGRAVLPSPGEHNLRNALAAMASCCQGFGVELTTAMAGLAQFEGVARRQDLIGTPRNISVYDDFAHHPTAVRETVAALRRRHPKGCLWAVYEPRTATACRGMHQQAYLEAFDAADRVILAPLGRSNIPAAERLDLDVLCEGLQARGKQAEQPADIDAIVSLLSNETNEGDVIALLSNGAFGGIHGKLLVALGGVGAAGDDDARGDARVKMMRSDDDRPQP